MTKTEVDFFTNNIGEKIPMTRLEKFVYRLEESWAYFLASFSSPRLGRKVYSESFGGITTSAIGLEKVHLLLNEYHKDFKNGDRYAAWRALIFCSEQNVPMPFWLASVIQKIDANVRLDDSNLVNLHSEFGMEKIAPIAGRRAISKRRYNRLRKSLYAAVLRAMRKRGSPELDPALSDALAENDFPFEKTKAYELYMEQERIQAGIRKMWDR